MLPESVELSFEDGTEYTNGVHVDVIEGLNYQYTCTTSTPVDPGVNFYWFLDGNPVLTEDIDDTVDCVAEVYQSQYTLNSVEFSSHHSKSLTCRAGSDNTPAGPVSSSVILNVEGRNFNVYTHLDSSDYLIRAHIMQCRCGY